MNTPGLMMTGVGACMLTIGMAAVDPVRASSPPPAAKVERFYGYVHDLKTGEYIYTEVQSQRIAADGRWTGGTIDYYAPDGKEIAHKSLDFSVDPYIPLYRLDN